MKTILEIQYKENNTTTKDIENKVKNYLKTMGIKTTSINTLEVYYKPDVQKAYFVATDKNGSHIADAVDVNEA